MHAVDRQRLLEMIGEREGVISIVVINSLIVICIQGHYAHFTHNVINLTFYVFIFGSAV